MQLKIQGHVLKLPIYLLLIKDIEVILGAAWLATLGPILLITRLDHLNFFNNNNFITFHGDKDVGPKLASRHQLHRLCISKAIAKCYNISVQDSITSTHQQMQSKPPNSITDFYLEFPTNMPESLRQLSLKYQIVFSLPIGLPPPRDCDHCIPLRVDIPPVKVSPYRYPHSQKLK